MAQKTPRNKRHLLLKICFPLSVLMAVTMVFSSALNLTSLSLDLSSNTTISFAAIPEEAVRVDRTAVAVISSLPIFLAPLSFLYFFIYWHRDDRTHLRSTILLALSTVNIAITAAGVAVAETSRGVLDIETALRLRPDVTAEQVQGGYDNWLTSTLRNTKAAFVAAVLDGIVRTGAVTFWLWLLPPQYRLPNRYEPVIHGRKKKRQAAAGDHSGSYVELVDRSEATTATATALPDTYAEIFNRHEKHWRDSRKKSTSRKSSPRNTQSSNDGAATASVPRKNAAPLLGGPRLEPSVRYWAVGRRRSSRKFYLGFLLLVTVFCDLFEAGSYIPARIYDLQCPWYCHAGFVYPWLLTAWAITVAVLVRRRIPLDDTALLLGRRLDLFLWPALMAICILGLAVGAARLPLSFSSSPPNPYPEGTPQHAAWEAVDGLQTVPFPFFMLLIVSFCAARVFVKERGISGRRLV
ncbi:hypothetical protein AAE478_008400 [Parahypoxylon ruwenzoriense]